MVKKKILIFIISYKASFRLLDVYKKIPFKKLKKYMSGFSKVPLVSISAPTFVTGIDFSDHRNYWTYNYPAMMLTDTAFFRNPNYHMSTDTPDTLDYRRMAQVVEALFLGLQQY